MSQPLCVASVCGISNNESELRLPLKNWDENSSSENNYHSFADYEQFPLKEKSYISTSHACGLICFISFNVSIKDCHVLTWKGIPWSFWEIWSAGHFCSSLVLSVRRREVGKMGSERSCSTQHMPCCESLGLTLSFNKVNLVVVVVVVGLYVQLET